ncbi:MAG: DUF2892 domain-containing protein [Parcubacteria group bacterium]|jgi:hypothetical protein
MKNEGFVERGIQLTLSATLLVLALYWLSGVWAWITGAFALVVMIFAIMGFCLLYALLKVRKDNLGQPTVINISIIMIIYLAVLIGGGYASNFFSRKFFVEDFNAMNQYYKQALFETGQEKRPEARRNYDALVASYAVFQQKYTRYQPYVLRGDAQLIADLEKVAKIITDTKQDVYDGDLKKAHLALEQVRPLTQEIFKRNGFSMLAVTLVDFHDSMEKVLDVANAKNAAGVLAAYPEASDKLAAVEKEASDAEIQLIRANLDALLQLATENKNEALPAKAAELKSSFVKVYLQRG